MKHVSPIPPLHGPPDVGLGYFVLGIVGTTAVFITSVIGGLVWYIVNRKPILNKQAGYNLTKSIKSSYAQNTK